MLFCHTFYLYQNIAACVTWPYVSYNDISVNYTALVDIGTEMERCYFLVGLHFWF